MSSGTKKKTFFRLFNRSHNDDKGEIPSLEIDTDTLSREELVSFVKELTAARDDAVKQLADVDRLKDQQERLTDLLLENRKASEEAQLEVRSWRKVVADILGKDPSDVDYANAKELESLGSQLADAKLHLAQLTFDRDQMQFEARSSNKDLNCKLKEALAKIRSLELEVANADERIQNLKSERDSLRMENSALRAENNHFRSVQSRHRSGKTRFPSHTLGGTYRSRASSSATSSVGFERVGASLNAQEPGRRASASIVELERALDGDDDLYRTNSGGTAPSANSDLARSSSLSRTKSAEQGAPPALGDNCPNTISATRNELRSSGENSASSGSRPPVAPLSSGRSSSPCIAGPQDLQISLDEWGARRELSSQSAFSINSLGVNSSATQDSANASTTHVKNATSTSSQFDSGFLEAQSSTGESPTSLISPAMSSPERQEGNLSNLSEDKQTSANTNDSNDSANLNSADTSSSSSSFVTRPGRRHRRVRSDMLFGHNAHQLTDAALFTSKSKLSSSNATGLMCEISESPDERDDSPEVSTSGCSTSPTGRSASGAQDILPSSPSMSLSSGKTEQTLEHAGGSSAAEDSHVRAKTRVRISALSTSIRSPSVAKLQLSSVGGTTHSSLGSLPSSLANRRPSFGVPENTSTVCTENNTQTTAESFALTQPNECALSRTPSIPGSANLLQRVFDDVPLFASLDRTEQDVLCARFEAQRFADQDVVHGPDDPLDTFYVVIEGAVAVFEPLTKESLSSNLAAPRRYAKGDFFLGEQVAKCHVIAKGSVTCLLLPSGVLGQVLDWFANARQLADIAEVSSLVGTEQQIALTSQLKADFASADTLAGYLSILRRNAATLRAIPLRPTREETASMAFAQMLQARKDLMREECVFINGIKFSLGSSQRYKALVEHLHEVVSTIFKPIFDVVLGSQLVYRKDMPQNNMQECYEDVAHDIVVDILVAACRTETGGDSYARCTNLFCHGDRTTLVSDSAGSSAAAIVIAEGMVEVQAVNSYWVRWHGDDESTLSIQQNETVSRSRSQNDSTTNALVRQTSLRGLQNDQLSSNDNTLDFTHYPVECGWIRTEIIERISYGTKPLPSHVSKSEEDAKAAYHTAHSRASSEAAIASRKGSAHGDESDFDDFSVEGDRHRRSISEPAIEQPKDCAEEQDPNHNKSKASNTIKRFFNQLGGGNRKSDGTEVEPDELHASVSASADTKITYSPLGASNTSHPSSQPSIPSVDTETKSRKNKGRRGRWWTLLNARANKWDKSTGRDLIMTDDASFHDSVDSSETKNSQLVQLERAQALASSVLEKDAERFLRLTCKLPSDVNK